MNGQAQGTDTMRDYPILEFGGLPRYQGSTHVLTFEYSTSGE